MDVDGFDPFDPPEDMDWRDDLEEMGERFQEQLKAKGIKRRLPPKPSHLEGSGLITAEEARERLNMVPLPPESVECPRCSGAGGGLLSNGDWDECENCRGVGEIPNPERPVFRFTSF